MLIVILIVLVLVPGLLVLAGLVVRKLLLGRDARRDPVNIKVLRGAGDGLRERIIQHSEDFDAVAIFMVLLGPMLFIAWAYRWMTDRGFDWSQVSLGGFEVLLLVSLLVALGICYGLSARHASAIRKYRQGLAAELATAQCLNQVMAEGGLVFHDFPGDGFNIDHIVIGQGAVFAIETKSRLKPGKGGKESARVAYDGSRLVFPEHTETRPLEQARFQAEWLARFLASGVGEPVRVIPYVALPGWYVENKVSRPEVLVGNPRNPMFMVRDGFGPALGETMKRRVAHVLSERYPAKAG